MPPRWQRYLAGMLLVAAVLWIIFDWPRFVADFWPPDSSRVGPNLVAAIVQAVFILIVLALVYPPTRHWIERAIESHAHDLKGKVDEQTDALEKKLHTLHTCLDHIIENHPDIPSVHGTDLEPPEKVSEP
jgi:hypothetical protein